MAEKKLLGALLLVVCGGISLVWGVQVARSGPIGMLDFKALYYSTSSLIHHHDPYDPTQLRAFCITHIESVSEYSYWMLNVLGLIDYLPTLFPLVAPFALLSWGPAHILWLVLSAASFFLSVTLIGSLAAREQASVTVWLLALLLVNLELFFGGGNAAAIIVGLAGIAVWCLLQERFMIAGVLCLAATLAIKPHDAGLIWLYFLLSGGSRKRRALEVLAADVVLAVIALVWVAHVAPHWMGELRSNLALYDAPGGANSPGIAVSGPNIRNFNLAIFPGMVVGLQSVFAPIWGEPRIYNSLTYLVCTPLIAIWIAKTVRSRYSLTNAYLAIAAIVPLTLLVTYHRTTDAKLLLLTIPACALLWSEGGKIGKAALFLTATGIVITGDITLTILGMLIGEPDWFRGGLAHKIDLVVLTRPVPLALLAMAVFYLWVYVRRAGEGRGQGEAAAG